MMRDAGPQHKADGIFSYSQVEFFHQPYWIFPMFSSTHVGFFRYFSTVVLDFSDHLPPAAGTGNLHPRRNFVVLSFNTVGFFSTPSVSVFVDHQGIMFEKNTFLHPNLLMRNRRLKSYKASIT
jgi:hypothetical protein